MARILFVTSPFGGFFRQCAEELGTLGHQVWRIAWDGGDYLSTPSKHRITFKAHEADRESFLRKAVRKHHITAIVTYNDTGVRNQAAIRIAKEMGLSRYILEHGYLRPHWVTIDRDGVNGHSTLPKDWSFYQDNGGDVGAAQPFPCRMRDQVMSTIRHFGASIALYPVLPFDTQYYGHSIFKQGFGYVNEYLWRKTRNEATPVRELAFHKQEGKKLFAVILQKPGDAQLLVHSKYGANNPFLYETCKSFAAFAPKDAMLVVKQHPLDYGVEESPRLFRKLVRKFKLEGRACYLRKTSIDIVLDNVDGFVVINSTAGLTAVERGLPVKCCGSAVFDMEGLTFQGSLDSFWTAASAPDPEKVNAFVRYLKRYSQVGGALYAPAGMRLAAQALCGIISRDLFCPHNEVAVEPEMSWERPALVPLAQAAGA
jgi:capsular polysaccharide export protein